MDDCKTEKNFPLPKPKGPLGFFFGHLGSSLPPLSTVNFLYSQHESPPLFQRKEGPSIHPTSDNPSNLSRATPPQHETQLKKCGPFVPGSCNGASASRASQCIAPCPPSPKKAETPYVWPHVGLCLAGHIGIHNCSYSTGSLLERGPHTLLLFQMPGSIALGTICIRTENQLHWEHHGINSMTFSIGTLQFSATDGPWVLTYPWEKLFLHKLLPKALTTK